MHTSESGASKAGAIDVLVVDDDTDAAEELVEYLSKANLDCRYVSDGWAALELLTEGCRPSVVVSDLRMPELNGLEFAERLAALGDGDRPEIIFVSGNAEFDDAVEAIRLGARDMITKPVDGPKLVRAVKSALLIRRRHGAPPVPPVAEARKTASEAAPSERKKAALNDLRSIRKVRSRYFPSELFSDPCWEMLLDLYDARLAAAEVTVTSLSVASGVPSTTALRRIETLQGHGLIERISDADDKRRTIIRLTTAGLEAVEKFFETYLERRSV